MKKSIKLILSFSVGVIFGILLFFTVFSFSNNNIENTLGDIKYDENNNINESNSDNNHDLSISENIINDSEQLENPVSYFERINNSADKNNIKESFISIIDFIFYDGSINGYTFNELSDSAKLKIMQIALSIDSKIDEYFPDYKDTISTGTKKIYNNVKIYLVELYLNTTTKICNANMDLCQQAKEDFQFMKQSFGITWDLLKSIAGNGLDKLKEWYEIFRSN